jgi:hypothetical protein
LARFRPGREVLGPNDAPVAKRGDLVVKLAIDLHPAFLAPHEVAKPDRDPVAAIDRFLRVEPESSKVSSSPPRSA